MPSDSKPSPEKRRVAFCGTRGLPANYGGFETAVDEITRRLVTKGYACDVFCRLSHSSAIVPEHEGRRLIYVRGAHNPRLETFLSAFQTGWYLLRHRKEYDHVFWFNNANFPGILLTLLSGIPFTVNTDGLEWRRKKWTWPFKAYYFAVSLLLSHIAPRLISDSKAIQAYYQKRFGRRSFLIPYGVPGSPSVSEEEAKRILQQYGLEKEKYFLQITRFEPDNLPLEIAQAFIASRLHEKGFHYVAVGFQKANRYALRLKALSRKGGVKVLPATYDPRLLTTLRTHCFAYVHGNSVGGTNPALLEALVTAPRVLAIDVPFTREVLGEAGIYFTLATLPQTLIKALQSPPRRETLLQRASWYNWDAVAQCYEAIINDQIPSYSPSPNYLDNRRPTLVVDP